jgi:hypothetical protein
MNNTEIEQTIRVANILLRLFRLYHLIKYKSLAKSYNGRGKRDAVDMQGLW